MSRMIHRIKTADDVAWFLDHTRAFPGGRVTDLHVHKQFLFDETSEREIPAGTIITAVIRYELAVRENGELAAVNRVAKLTMKGVTDFSIFEQEGRNFSQIGVIHAEASGGRLRFWFDPHGELYVICDEAQIEEVSKPGTGLPIRAGMTEWTFQAESGDLPDITWLLARLDQAGFPCAWRAMKHSPSSHPAMRWTGHLIPTFPHGLTKSNGIQIQAFGPLDGSSFGITLRASDPNEANAARLLTVAADIIARNFTGLCLASNHVVERDEWLNGRTEYTR